MFKKCPVVMLPSNEKAYKGDIVRLVDGYMELMDISMSVNQLSLIKAKVFNLYFLSDEEIKTPCWCINKNRDTLYFIKDNFESANKDWDIVIATTDKCLFINKFIGYTYTGGKSEAFSHINLPQPSRSFLEKFVIENNKQVNCEVMVEYEEILGDEGIIAVALGQTDKILKVNPKDNTITISKMKDNWNRDELIILLNKFGSKVYGEYTKNETMEDFTDKWIEENL